MVYNAFAATNPRLKRQAHSEASTKPAVSPVSAAREELKAAGERAGWTIRELTFDEVQRMSSSELRFHETFNRQNLDRAFELEQNKRWNREQMRTWDIRRKWKVGDVSEGEVQQARKAGAIFAERHPRFERTESNALKICEYMSENNLDPTVVSSYATAFTALVEAGEMKLATVLSADDFLAEHPELRDTRIPPLIEARNAKAANTQKLFEKARAASAEGASVRVVDYPKEQHGVPAQPDKASFKKKIAAMSADDIRAECAVNPAFREALDNLK